MTTIMATPADGPTNGPVGTGTDEATKRETQSFRIGDLAREFDVTLRTLRFYEDKGIIAPERRGTTRIYSPADRDRLQLALFGKRIGLPLKEVRAMLEKHDRPGTEDEIEAILQRQREVLTAQRAELDATLAELDARLAA